MNTLYLKKLMLILFLNDGYIDNHTFVSNYAKIGLHFSTFLVQLKITIHFFLIIAMFIFKAHAH